MFNSWQTAAHQPLTTAKWLIAWGWLLRGCLQRMAAEDTSWESLLRKALRIAAEKGCSSKSLLLFKISFFIRRESVGKSAWSALTFQWTLVEGLNPYKGRLTKFFEKKKEFIVWLKKTSIFWRCIISIFEFFDTNIISKKCRMLLI